MAQVTLNDIAQKLGISVVTVSNALNGKAGVSAQLRLNIINTAQILGYKKYKTGYQSQQDNSHNSHYSYQPTSVPAPHEAEAAIVGPAGAGAVSAGAAGTGGGSGAGAADGSVWGTDAATIQATGGNGTTLRPNGLTASTNFFADPLSGYVARQQPGNFQQRAPIHPVPAASAGGFGAAYANISEAYHHSNMPQPSFAPQHHALGVIIAKRYLRIGASFYWELYQHTAFTASDHGFTTTIIILDDAQIAQGFIPMALQTRSLDGFIVMGPMEHHYLQLLSTLNLPSTMLDYHDEGINFPAVLSHNYFNSYKMTRYLIQKGHILIGFLGNRHGFDNIAERFYGYRRALSEARLKYCPQWTLDDRDPASGTTYDEIALPEELPTAFVCNCDISANNLYNTLNAHGFKVPHDISIVGYDNYLYGSDFARELTTLDVNFKALAFNCVNTLIKVMSGKPLASKVLRLEGTLIERSSVRDVSTPDAP